VDDEGDSHVFELAVAAGSGIIVSSNVKEGLKVLDKLGAAFAKR